ncbi:hypothetical protein [Bacillus thuringiensis]|uniref:hypothetical protein n=1 Tax=Bacillus thuringiensis TaxID=1428 RepID=UPI002AB554E4|nr:hypothetical protein [Bacillus thuringiensis]MCU4863856.1 hypothetical protein [Bacillus cereus]MDY7964463.1 hypothetical protein [Bacillus thuringiensis]
MEALPYIMTLLFVLFVFSFIIIGNAPSNVIKITGAVVMVVSLIGIGVGGYFKIIESDQMVKQKNERIAYNEKKQEELLTEKLKLPITDILIEQVSKTEYYKVTTNTGIYKLAYAYDPNDRVIGFKEFKQITSTIN